MSSLDLFEQLAQSFEDPSHQAPDELEADSELWLRTLFPDKFDQEFAEYQLDFWRWVASLRRGVRPRAFIAVWPRGAGKSMSAEAACVRVGASGTRRYALYVSATQDLADDHVQTIGQLLESLPVEQYYPTLAAKSVNKFGTAKGWRRNRLRTKAGLTVDAIGLDTAARGKKLDADRPDLIILDDIDEEFDTPATVKKKIKMLTKKLIPAGSADVAVLGVQNLVHEFSIFAKLASGEADFLANRILSGPHKALNALAYEERPDREQGAWVIVSGEPTWAGMGIERCQAMVDDMGISAFLEECQHEVDAPPGGMYNHLSFRHCRWDEVPDLVRIVVVVDPAITFTDDSDSHAIQADGIAEDGTIYRLFSWENRTTPQDSMTRAIKKALELGASQVGVETDQGGDTWEIAYKSAWRELMDEDKKRPFDDREFKSDHLPSFVDYKAGSTGLSKEARSARMLQDYERNRIVHVLGTHDTLEKALHRFPKTKPFDLADAAFWGWQELREGYKHHMPWILPMGVQPGSGRH